MSLDATYTRIKNWEQICYKDDKLNPVTHHLVFATMFIGMHQISEQNWEHFYQRLSIYERVFGWHLQKFNDDGSSDPVYVTPQDVKDHIGLSTNASTLTVAAFKKKIWEYQMEQANERLKDAERLAPEEGRTQ